MDSMSLIAGLEPAGREPYFQDFKVFTLSYRQFKAFKRFGEGKFE